jgi:hypothetical protein
MRQRGIVQWMMAGLSFLALVVPLGRVVAQCGGTCASYGSCPATGYGCNPTVCCYCCTTCQTGVCGTLPAPGCRKPGGGLGTTLVYYWMDDWYNCYVGTNCTYDHTQSNTSCWNGCVICV